jgi:hypothetical protein
MNRRQCVWRRSCSRPPQMQSAECAAGERHPVKISCLDVSPGFGPSQITSWHGHGVSSGRLFILLLPSPYTSPSMTASRCSLLAPAG